MVSSNIIKHVFNALLFSNLRDRGRNSPLLSHVGVHDDQAPFHPSVKVIALYSKCLGVIHCKTTVFLSLSHLQD